MIELKLSFHFSSEKPWISGEMPKLGIFHHFCGMLMKLQPHSQLLTELHILNMQAGTALASKPQRPQETLWFKGKHKQTNLKQS